MCLMKYAHAICTTASSASNSFVHVLIRLPLICFILNGDKLDNYNISKCEFEYKNVKVIKTHACTHAQI